MADILVAWTTKLAEGSNIRCRTQTPTPAPDGVGHPEAAPVEAGDVEADDVFQRSGPGRRDAGEKHEYDEIPRHVGV